MINRRNLISGATAAALAVAAIMPALAQEQGAPARIVVSGEGTFAVAPDMATLSLTVMREADTAAEAMKEANETMAAVIATLKEAGISPRDLQTGGLQISPQYNYPSSSTPKEKPRVSGYQVQNTLVAQIRDLDSLGSIIDKAVTLGVNQGANITLSNDDPSAAMNEARKLAVADAMARARTLAQASGTQLGRIVKIVEPTESAPPQPMAVKAFRADAAAAVPIEFGENSYRVAVTITFEIER